MQYILTQEELDALKNKDREAEKLPSVKDLQKFCSMVADTLSVKSGWYKGRVWGCILTTRKSDEWFCDDCPAVKVCPYEHKEWSK